MNHLGCQYGPLNGPMPFGSEKINYNQLGAQCLYGPQTINFLQADSNFENQHARECAAQIKSCIRYIPHFNIFLYASESMSSPQQGQVHMMVMPKCNEPSASEKAAAEAKKKEENKDKDKEKDNEKDKDQEKVPDKEKEPEKEKETTKKSDPLTYQK